MTQHVFHYDDIQDALERLNTTLFASEIHGTLCGLLCIKNGASAQGWLSETLQDVDQSNLLLKEAIDQLASLVQDTAMQINDPVFDFHLLLPDDDVSLDTRLECLGDWCQGFLAGLSMGGISDLKSLPQDAIEIATDMAEIARAGTSYDVSESEEDESAYQELVEYIRVGVLLIYEELHALASAPAADPDSPPTVH